MILVWSINNTFIWGEPRRLWVVHGGNVSHIMMSSFWLSGDVFMALLRRLAWNQAQSQDVMKAAASFHCIKTAFYLLVPPILLHPNQQSLAFHANTAFCAFVFSPLAKLISRMTKNTTWRLMAEFITYTFSLQLEGFQPFWKCPSVHKWPPPDARAECSHDACSFNPLVCGFQYIFCIFIH